MKGQKRTSGRSSNTRAEDNVISNGAGIAVAEGQCMIIVEQGKVVEFCAEPGQFTWDTSSEPSVLAGSFGESLLEEFVSALGPALPKLFLFEIRPNQIPAHTNDLEKYLNEELSDEWGARGIGDVKVAINPPTLTEEDQELLKTVQKTAMYCDPTMAAATMIGAQGDAMRAAASNEAGAMTGVMGMGMAMNAGGVNAQSLFGMGQQTQQQPAPATPASGGWKCACGGGCYGQFLHGMRCEKACRRRLGLHLRFREQGQILSRVRCKEACRRTAVQM